MAARPVQVSLDTALLKQIDSDPEAKKHGRSAFIRAAVELYLVAKRKRAIDTQIKRAFSRTSDELLEDVAELIESQAWPEE